MKNNWCLFFVIFIVSMSCQKDKMVVDDSSNCTPSFEDSSSVHPKNSLYQTLLTNAHQQGIVGISVMINDADGCWLGTEGKANIATNSDVQPCNRFLIASVSKVFTATAIFTLIDQGVLSLTDPLNKWIPTAITDKIENANDVNLEHLLGHTSGIADYYTHQFELDRINVVDNQWTQEDILAYVYGKPATNASGESYFYSNTNYLLLGMVLENATGMSLEDVYKTTIFDPANLESAYFSATSPVPSGTVKGYVDMNGNGNFMESSHLYHDELGTADGGIAINAFDLGRFMEKLISGEIISASSLELMQKWINLPEMWVDNELGHFQNGLGLEHYSTEYGNAVGHSGTIDGFKLIALYFPASNSTLVVLVNSVSGNNEARIELIKALVKAIFD